MPESISVPAQSSDQDYRNLASLSLSDLPADASAAQVWSALGAAGVITGLYRSDDPALPVATPGRLAALLAAVDARGNNGVTLSVLVQAASAVPLLASAAGGSVPLRCAVARLVAGRSSVALAATDADAAGSDLSELGTEVAIGSDVLVLNGGKRWITSACWADYLLVLARHRPGRHFTSFVWVLVPASAAGVSVRPADSGLLTGAGLGHITLDEVRLPIDHLLGRPGRGMAAFARQMGVERLAGAQWAVALTSRVLADTQKRLVRRSSAGQPLWHNDTVRQRFATALVRVRQLRALCDVLGDPVVAGQDATGAALLKAAAGLTVDAVLAVCAQLQGADGFAVGAAQEIRAEAAVFGIGGGVTELMLAVVADNCDSVLADLRL